MIGYKIFTIVEDKLFSLSDPGRIQYHKHGWTCRPFICGPLAVFSSFPLAKKYLLSLCCSTFIHTGFKIYKVHYILSKKSLLYTNNFLGLIRRIDLPFGTVLADRVKLISPSDDFGCFKETIRDILHIN